MDSIYSANRERIKTILGVDDGLLYVLEEDYNSLYVSARNPVVLFFAYIGLAVLYFFVRLLYGFRTRIDTKGDEFVFFSCPDVVFRVRNLPLIAADLKYSIIFLPTFHIKSAIQYHRYFKDQGVKAIFLMPRIGDAFAVLHSRNKHCKQYSSLAFRDKSELNRLKTQMYTYLIYKSIADRTLGAVSDGKVVFEHQKFFFIPFVCWFRNRGVTTYLLQHGSFFHPSYNYFPLLCDVVLCCSEREKLQYLKNDVSPERVVVFGTPLQSLVQPAENGSRKAPEYKYLVLMPLVTEERLPFIGKVLSYLKSTVPCDRILVRLRPRSAVQDRQMLESELEGLTISGPGNTLAADVEKAERVVSFSEDCVFELCRSGRLFIIASDARSIDPILDGKYCTEQDYASKLDAFDKDPESFVLTDTERLYLFGDMDVLSLKRKFVEFIRG